MKEGAILITGLGLVFSIVFYQNRTYFLPPEETLITEKQLEEESTAAATENPNSTQTEELDRYGERIEMPDLNFPIPSGWYRSDKDEGEIWLTRHEILPKISGVGATAFGPQMSLYQVSNNMNFNGVFQNYSQNKDNIEFGTTTLNKITLIKRATNASGTANNVLYYYLPAGEIHDRRTYVFFLYPYRDEFLEDFNYFVISALKELYPDLLIEIDKLVNGFPVGWAKYSDEMLKFSFWHPEEWLIEGNLQGERPYMVVTSTIPNNRFKVEILRFPLNGSTFEEWVDGQENQISEYQKTVISSKSLTVGGKPAIQIKQSFSISVGSTTYINNGDEVYLFNASGKDAAYDKFIDTLLTSVQFGE